MRSLFVGLLVLAAVSVSAQSRTPAAPRTADGHPDLQGTWDFAQLTPFERPGDYAGKETVTEEEAEEFAQKRIETTHKDRRDGGAAADVERAYNDFWWDFGRRIAKQPSLVVDPPDGRIPALLPDAQKRIADRRNHYDNPEERPLAERCILGFNSGPPMVPSAYNNNMQLVQTRDRVLILNEMIHSARLVDLSGRPHHPTHIRFLTGDSIGRWEGDTLVVDTTNFSTDAGFRGASTRLHLVERFTREGADALRYEFTVDDPATWTKKWSASIPMARTDERIFEYACHEGNYALARRAAGRAVSGEADREAVASAGRGSRLIGEREAALQRFPHVIRRRAVTLEPHFERRRARERAGKCYGPAGTGRGDASDLQRHAVLPQHRICHPLHVGVFHGPTPIASRWPHS